MDKNFRVLEIVQRFLIENKYDGLYNEEGCACCLGKEFEPCGEMSSECIAGYKKEGCSPDCGEGCDFHIVEEKPKIT